METIKFGRFTDGFYETGNQVHDWIIHRARQYMVSEREQKKSLTDKEAVVEYQNEKRRRFLDNIGGLPAEVCELGTLETGVIQRDGYSIRNLIYRSLPSFYVTSNLYIPDGALTPAPGVLMGCGHSKPGKAAPLYQKVCIDLVRAGFVVLIIDSPSHGEMLQCVDRKTGEPLSGWNTREHSFLQLSASVIGQNIARYFIWNAMRGIDLLCSLPQVDAGRIAMTGNSGGGHLTQMVMMVDGRVKVAMPCCSLTTRESYLQTGVRAYDGEQNFFGAISGGLDYEDFLSCFAPRPLRVGAAGHDYFCIEGVLEAVGRAREIYNACEAGDNLDLLVAQNESHGYSAPLRRGCIEWFSRHLLGRDAEIRHEDPAAEEPEALQCTRSGQVLTEFGDARSIIDLNMQQWRAARPACGASPAGTAAKLRELLLPGPAPRLHPRCTSRSECDLYVAERIFFFTEPDIAVTAVLYRPSGLIRGAVLLLVPGGTEGQEGWEGTIGDIVADGRIVMVFDPRGTGAVKMRSRNHADGFEFRSTEFRVANDHFMLGTSLASRRAYDILRALEYLRRHAGLPDAADIEMIASGPPALWGLAAAVADGRLAGCSFSGLPRTWGEAFGPAPPDPERISESLIMPELKAAVDIPDLLDMVT